MGRRVVIGYDGSEEARSAVDVAARVLFADCALVVNVWHDLATFVPAPAAAPPIMPTPQQEAELERTAWAVAEEGTELARAAGMEAMTAIRRGCGAGDVAHALHDVAEAYEAELVVVGHRHASWLESVLRGSVSSSALRDERRPVLVVPG